MIGTAIICAAVFIGVGTTRFILKREERSAQNAANSCNIQVMGTDESCYAYQAGFPPSYSTGMPAESF